MSDKYNVRRLLKSPAHLPLEQIRSIYSAFLTFRLGAIRPRIGMPETPYLESALCTIN